MSDFDKYLKLQLAQTLTKETSSHNFIVIGGNIVMNNTNQTDDVIQYIYSTQPEKLDGIFSISCIEENIHIKRRNLVELETINFFSKENEINFKKLLFTYTFLEYLC
jgi:hypothetical protein